MHRSALLLMVTMAMGFTGCALPATNSSKPPSLPMPNVTMSQMFNPVSYPTIGIYVENLSGQRLSAGTIRVIEDEFMRRILANGYALAARSDIEKIMREQKLQSSGVTEEAMARVGRVLNVPAVILVSINSLTAERTQPPMVYDPNMRYYRVEATMSARLIGAERAEVLWISSYGESWRVASGPGNPRDRWPEALLHVAEVVARGFPPRK